jgi:hypothetical protein
MRKQHINILQIQSLEGVVEAGKNVLPVGVGSEVYVAFAD